jgi:protein-S-isoprenylcysteine O-methyltransferase Ste14
LDTETVKIFLAWAAFGAFHSLTVSEGYDRLARRAMGERAFAAFHRLLFSAYSAAAAAAALLYIRSLPDAPLYRIDGWPRILLHAVQASGAALLLWTPWDLLDFIGLRRFLRGEEPGNGGRKPLFTGKAYGIVRHPIYFGCSVLLAFHPAQTRNSLASTAAVVAYFYVGTFLEERRMERAFGEEYREYKKRVPRFFPIPRPWGQGDRGGHT